MSEEAVMGAVVDSEVVQGIVDRFPGLERADVLQAVDAMYAASAVQPVIITLVYNPVSRHKHLSLVPELGDMTEKLVLDVSEVLHDLAQRLVAAKLSQENADGKAQEG